jgi:preprotein translocase subunit SecB
MSEQPQQAAPAPVLSIEKVYVKDCSIEVPGAPQVFFENVQPQIDVQLQTATGQVGEGLFECVLTITVTAKTQERSVFLVEAAQAGIFQIRGFTDQDMEMILGIGCPTSLFPYARETVSSLVNRAGFPPINLAPISFEALYAQRLQEQRQQQAQQPTH